jgi:uncharacterized protein (TIGR02757 family)
MNLSMNRSELKDFLDDKTQKYNHRNFIETDPVQVPHQFSRKENIEIAAFFTATIAWGNRLSIINNAIKLSQIMDNQPYDFILNASTFEKNKLLNFKHRTFNGIDCIYFVDSLKNIYQHHGGMQTVFEKGFSIENSIKSSLSYFYDLFFEIGGERTRKHVSNIKSGSSGKRLNLFLRWMIRNDNAGVDFGIWNGIPSSELMLPLDVHTGNVARKLGLLQRKQNDWKAVEEVTSNLRLFDPADPIKYDFALFGLGAFEKF